MTTVSRRCLSTIRPDNLRLSSDKYRWGNGDIPTWHHLILITRSDGCYSPGRIIGLVQRVKQVAGLSVDWTTSRSIHRHCIHQLSHVAAFTVMATVTETVTLPYVQAPETSADLDWADLATLDLSKFDQPGGKQELATTLARALENIGKFNQSFYEDINVSHPKTLIHGRDLTSYTGFFYVSNHGLTTTEIDTQFALAHSVLSLSDSSKAPYRAALEQGDYNGWKPAGTRNLIPGVKDNFEIYNIPKFIPAHANRPHPDVVRQHWGTIRTFSQRVHEQIVKKLLVVFAVALGLEDEEWFLKRHRYEENSGDHLRYMKYHARSEEENQKLGGVWLKG